MKPRILILTDPIGKPSYAPRLRFLCDYLVEKGYEIEVCSERIQDYSFPHSYPIHEQTIYRNRLDWALKSFWSLLTDWRNRHFTRFVRQQIEGKVFDLVLCTTFSTFPLRTARTIAQERHIPFLADIRDLDEQVPGAQYQSHRQWFLRPFRAWYRAVNIRRRNRELRQANAITTISPWHADFIRTLFLSAKRSDSAAVSVIYNGYDAHLFYPQDIPAERFTISYIGKLYEFQNMDPIRQAVAELNLPDIQLSLHTPDHDPIPVSAVGEEIRRSSIMLVLTDKAAKGMMTTKFYEALGCEKPILCYPDDEGLLAQTIRDTNAGIAADEIKDIKAFILHHYQQWKQNGFTRQPVNQDHKQFFSRQYQTRQMEDCITSLLTPPTVSVIIPAYNAAPYLPQCLDSLINQTYTHWKAIVVDDESSDESASVIRRYMQSDSRITLLSQAHGGLPVARNHGLRHADGTYVTFLDADDRLDERFLETLLTHIGNHDVVQSGFLRFDSRSGKILSTKKAPHFYRFTSSCARLYKRSFLENQHLTFPEGHYYEDVIFSMGLWTKRPSHTVLPYCGYHYRLNEHSITSSSHDEDRQWLFRTIRQGAYPLWLKLYTILRLKMHYWIQT